MKLQSLQSYLWLVPSVETVIIMYSNNLLFLHFLINKIVLKNYLLSTKYFLIKYKYKYKYKHLKKHFHTPRTQVHQVLIKMYLSTSTKYVTAGLSEQLTLSFYSIFICVVFVIFREVM